MIEGLLEEECPKCFGSGHVTTPEWENWLKVYNAVYSQVANDPLLLASAKFDSDITDKARETADDKAGNEPLLKNMECPVCDGRSYVPTELGWTVLALVQRHA